MKHLSSKSGITALLHKGAMTRMRHFLLHQHHLFAMQTDTFAIPMQEHSNNPIISDNEYHDKKQNNEPRQKIWHKGIPGGCCSHSPVNRIRMGYRQADFHRQHLAPPVGRQRFYPAVLILRPENRTIRHKPGSRHMGRRQPRCISGFRRHNKQADIISDDTCRRQYNHLPPSGFRIFRAHWQRRGNGLYPERQTLPCHSQAPLPPRKRFRHNRNVGHRYKQREKRCDHTTDRFRIPPDKARRRMGHPSARCMDSRKTDG